jgi:hypothetical protein
LLLLFLFLLCLLFVLICATTATWNVIATPIFIVIGVRFCGTGSTSTSTSTSDSGSSSSSISIGPDCGTEMIRIVGEWRAAQQNVVVTIVVAVNVAVGRSFHGLFGWLDGTTPLLMFLLIVLLLLPSSSDDRHNWQETSRLQEDHAEDLVPYHFVKSFEDRRGLAKGHVLVGMFVGDAGFPPKRRRRIPLPGNAKAVDEDVRSVVVDGVEIVVPVGDPFALAGPLPLVVALGSELFPALDERIHDIVDDGTNRFPATRMAIMVVSIIRQR